MDDRLFIEVVDPGHNLGFELLLGGDPNMPEDRAGEFREEAR